MLQVIQTKFKQLRVGLTHLNQQPIGKAVLIIVLGLDLFILVSIFQGLSDHTRQLITPYEAIPQQCRDIVIDEKWHQDNQLIHLAENSSRHRGSYRYIDDKDRMEPLHPACAPLETLMQAIKKDKDLSKQLARYRMQRKVLVEAKSELEHTRGAYNTSLLEVIAESDSSSGDTRAIKQRVSEITRRLNTLTSEEIALVAALNKHALIKEIFALIDQSPKQYRETLLEDLRRLNFWHPVKRLGMEMMFLLPLIIVFFLWHSKSIAASWTYQRLVSSHLLVVVFIPVIFKVIELVYDILPKKILKQVIELLESLNLVAVWHYLMMGGGIVAALALIYVMQQKVFSQQKIIQKRISKGQCQDCGVGLPSGTSACSRCGFKQYRECGSCQKETFVYGIYCRECGAEGLEQ